MGALLLSRSAALAHIPAATARSYEFLTLTRLESSVKNQSKLLIALAFNGRTEIQLEALGAFLPGTRLAQLRRNEETLAQCLSDLSAVGWELIQVSAAPLITDKDVAMTRYLCRKAKN